MYTYVRTYRLTDYVIVSRARPRGLLARFALSTTTSGHGGAVERCGFHWERLLSSSPQQTQLSIEEFISTIDMLVLNYLVAD